MNPNENALLARSLSESRAFAARRKAIRAIAILSLTALAVAGLLWGVA